MGKNIQTGPASQRCLPVELIVLELLWEALSGKRVSQPERTCRPQRKDLISVISAKWEMKHGKVLGGGGGWKADQLTVLCPPPSLSLFLSRLIWRPASRLL